MSEAPRVELNSTETDFDLSAQTNPFQQTNTNTPQRTQQFDSNSSPQSNGNTAQNLQNSAIKAKDSLLDSKVSGTERLPRLPRHNLTEYITVLSAFRTTPDFLNLHTQSSNTSHERRQQPPQRAEREGDRYER
jgi:hypothetical protein